MARQRLPAVARQRLPDGSWRTLTPNDYKDHSAQPQMADVPAAMRQAFLTTLMPKGYPHTVASNYTPYVQWTVAGLLAGRVQGVLATQAALFAIGLGAGAVPMAAAVQWVVKDGIGHAGAVVYATAVNTRFDTDAKRHRFHSTVAHTLADMIAVLMPLWPHHFLLMASTSATLSSTAALAHASARARIMASFSKGGNLADLTRAGQTQSKLSGLLGTAAGAGVSWGIGPEPLHVLAACMPLAAASLYAMHRSSQLVVLSSLNLQRTERVYRHLVDQLGRAGEGGLRLHAPSPATIAREESFFLGYASVFGDSELRLNPLVGGPPKGAWLPPWLSNALHGRKAPAVLGAVEPLSRPMHPSEDGWRADWHGRAPGGPRGEDAEPLYAIAHTWAAPAQVLVWHRPEASPEAKLRAVWHTCLLRHRYGAQPPREGDGAAELDALADSTWPAALEAMRRSEWNTDMVYLDGEGGCMEPV